MKINFCVIFIVVMFFGGCTKLRDLSEIVSNPSDQFIIDSDGLSKVSRAHPYMGSNESCAHAGAHLHFQSEDSPYLINVYAPVDGVIGSIDKCYDLGNGNDKFTVNLKFASHQGSDLSLSLSLEPFAGYLCQEDEDYYSQYIFVEEGQSVSKGDLLAKLYKPASGEDDTHIHFHVSSDLSSGFHCPNIFSDSVVSEFHSVLGEETCDGEVFGKTLCYNPADGEDLTGL